MPSPQRFASSALSRRALGVCVGVSAATAFLYSTNGSLPLPVIRSSSASRAATFNPVNTMSSSQQQRVAGSSAAAAAATPPPPPQGVKAVNLRDIGEIDPNRLRKGVLYRCSQIYTPEVLKDLKIRTVVDLRGRAERGKKKKDSSNSGTKPSSPTAAGNGGMGPPPLFNPEQVSALGAAQGDRIQGQPQVGGTPAGGDKDMQLPGAESEPQMDFSVTKLRRQGSAAGSMEGSVSEDDNGGGSGNGGNGVRMRGDTEEAAAALGSAADWQLPETEAFNVIPTKQFGYAMLRMPLRVWRGAFGNLLSGRDPRKPFVDAFADEQLLGFFRYYKIILEHSKSNIAAVLRVFAKDSSLPSLVHCAHGKDRTGVIIMLLLLICDTPHEAIVADYVQSEVELRKYRESLGLPDPTGATGAVIPLNEVIIASTQETLRALLAYMDSTYITVDNYLSSCGLTQAEVAAIRRNLMRPDALTVEGLPKGSAVAAATSHEPAGSA